MSAEVTIRPFREQDASQVRELFIIVNRLLELRRMYVDPSARRSGIARLMLQFAEAECRRLDMRRLELSTSELQPAALELYRHAGYRLLNEAVAEQASNKTLGGGIRRYYFEKIL